MDGKWYKKSCFRNLVDMHINNGDERLLRDFDANKYAKNMKTAGFDTAYIYGSNCLGLCLFNTKTGYTHQIVKERDIFGETVDACKKEGIRPVGYLNHWTTEAYNRHPEWRVVGKDGKGSREVAPNRCGVCCLNSPYEEYFLKLVEEMCSAYPIEGLWVDMAGYWKEACYCESCQKKYRETTGEEIPEIIDWDSPKWRRYVKFKEDTFAESIRKTVKTAKNAKPGISVSIQSACWNLGYFIGYTAKTFGEFDYSAGDFYTDVRDQAVDCKFLRNVTANMPFEYMVPRCPDLIYHTESKPEREIRQQAYSAFLHGGAFLLIDAIDPDGTLNEEVYESFGNIRKDLEPYWKLPSFLNGEYLNDAAVYINYRSMIDLNDNGKSTSHVQKTSPLIERLKKINRIFSETHIQYDIVSENILSEISKYPLVIISEIYSFSAEEIKAFREYVKNGGRLYISGKSGILNDLDMLSENDTTLRRDNFALSDVMGVKIDGEIPFDMIYLKEKEENDIFGNRNKAYPLSNAGPSLKIKADEKTEVLATATVPYSNAFDAENFVSALSNPPWRDTDIPVLTEHTYGKGSCVYSSLLLEDNTVDVLKKRWVNIINYMLRGKRNIIVEAPTCVEASVKKLHGDICVSLLNTLANETGAFAGKTTIKISESFCNLSSAECFPSGKVSFEKVNGEYVITASELPEFAVITIKE